MTGEPGPPTAAWALEVVDRLVLLRCSALQVVPGVAHAFSTRRDDGEDRFDLGAAGDRSEATRRRRERFLAAAGIDGEAAVLNQVHGTRVIDAEETCDGPPEADGAVWTGGRAAPSVRSADCVPILILDRAGRAAAAVHAGWRGTAAGIALRAVAALAERGIAPSEMVAAMGPAIGPCCYEVGREVIDAFPAGSAAAEGSDASRRGTTGRYLLDLSGTLRRQLAQAGLEAEAIHAAPWCTRCREDLFFSYRRDRDGAGRMMAVVGRRRRP